MKGCAAVVVAVISFTAVAADDAMEKAIKLEREKLQGRWKLTSIERNGKKGALGFDFFVVIKGDKWTSENQEAHEPKFQIDPTQNPKTIDIAFKDLGVEKGIYKLDKDTLTICIIDGFGNRPREFKSTDGHAIRVYQRTEK